MKIQRSWALLFGAVSAIVGILSFVPAVKISIPSADAVIHIVTGGIFIACAWLKKGKYVYAGNAVLGIFYIIWGIIAGMEWPHIIAGIVSAGISFLFRNKKERVAQQLRRVENMFEGRQIVVQGFQIPSDAPLFLAVLSIHILAGLICVISGALAMLAKKHHGFHSKCGSIYYWSLWIVFITMSIIAIARWKEDYYLFILGLISFCLAFTARVAIRNKWSKWTIVHISGMGLSYIFLLIAFYADNGKFLPIWRNFDPLVYSLLPAVVGLPIMVGTLLRHPLSRNYFRKK